MEICGNIINLSKRFIILQAFIKGDIKLDEIDNICIRGFTTSKHKKKSSNIMIPSVRIEPGTSDPELFVYVVKPLMIILPILGVCEKLVFMGVFRLPLKINSYFTAIMSTLDWADFHPRQKEVISY